MKWSEITEENVTKFFEKAAKEESSRDKELKGIENLDKSFTPSSELKKFSLVYFKRLFDFWITRVIKENFQNLRPYLIPKRMDSLIRFAKYKHNITLTHPEEFELKDYALKAAKAIAGENHVLGSQQAPPLMYQEGVSLCNELYYNAHKRSLLNSKNTALALKLMLYTGSRLGDLIYIKVGDIYISKAFNNDICLTIYINQKTDKLKRRNDRKTIFCPSQDKNNPLKWILENVQNKSDTDWLFKRPDGQNMTGDNIRYYLKTGAKRLNLEITPTGHSCRNAICSTLSLADVSDERIRIFLNWASDSDMPHWYKRHLLEKSEYGCAHALRNMILDGSITNIQNQIDKN